MLLKIFFSFLKIGLCSVGGGMAAMPLLQNELVTVNGWLTGEEFTDLVTIAEITPGPIAVNAATFVGFKMVGFLGAVIATIGVITAPCAIVFLLTFAYSKYSSLSMVQGILQGIRPAVVALITTAGMSILTMAIWNGSFYLKGMDIKNYIAALIFIVCFFILRKFKPNPIYVILGSGVIGGVIYSLLP